VNDIILTQLVKGEVKKQYGGMWKVYGGYVEGIFLLFLVIGMLEHQYNENALLNRVAKGQQQAFAKLLPRW